MAAYNRETIFVSTFTRDRCHDPTHGRQYKDRARTCDVEIKQHYTKICSYQHGSVSATMAAYKRETMLVSTCARDRCHGPTHGRQYKNRALSRCKWVTQKTQLSVCHDTNTHNPTNKNQKAIHENRPCAHGTTASCRTPSHPATKVDACAGGARNSVPRHVCHSHIGAAKSTC